MEHGILFDHARAARIGLPEAVFCEGKPFPALLELLSRFRGDSGAPVLFTRLAPEVFAQVPEEIRAGYDYHPLSRTAFSSVMPPRGRGRVAVVSAGTADGSVTWEAARTLQYLGIEHRVFEDCGVAGLDAALASVLGGLTPKPVFGVPTSVGYGVASGGSSALSSMLSSCAPGLGVLNIDNGYGAACAAARVVNAL